MTTMDADPLDPETNVKPERVESVKTPLVADKPSCSAFPPESTSPTEIALPPENTSVPFMATDAAPGPETVGG